MNATIQIINPTRSMVAAKSENGEYVIFELLGSYSPEIGDVVSHGDFHSMGGAKYHNVTQSEDMDVYVQNVVGSAEAAKKQCFLS